MAKYISLRRRVSRIQKNYLSSSFCGHNWSAALWKVFIMKSLIFLSRPFKVAAAINHLWIRANRSALPLESIIPIISALSGHSSLIQYWSERVRWSSHPIRPWYLGSCVTSLASAPTLNNHRRVCALAGLTPSSLESDKQSACLCVCWRSNPG